MDGCLPLTESCRRNHSTLDIQEPFNGPKEPLAIQPGHGMPWQPLHFLNHPMLENHGDRLTSHVPLPHEFIRK